MNRYPADSATGILRLPTKLAEHWQRHHQVHHRHISADSILHTFVLRALRQQDLGDAGQNRQHEPAVAPNIDRDPHHEQIDIRQLRNRLHGEDILRRAAHICRDRLHGSGTGPVGEIESNVSFTSQKTYSFRGLAQSFRPPAFGETYPADQRYR